MSSSTDASSSVFVRLARWYVRRKLERGLDGLYVSGLPELRDLLRKGPVLVASNHVAWWDPLALVMVDASLDCRSYALMDRDNLAKHRYFRWLGAVPIDRTGPLARRDLLCAASLLERPGTLLWVFAQGEQRPCHLRPLDFKAGVELLARRSGAPIVPASLTYAFRQRPQPALAIRFGAPLRSPGARDRNFVWKVESAVAQGLDANDALFRRPAEWLDDYELLVSPSRRAPEDGLGPRLLEMGAPRLERGSGAPPGRASYLDADASQRSRLSAPTARRLPPTTDQEARP